ncbi:MAG: tRNA pseudouridine(38-40) synthase TruA [Arenimonas sp.]
MRYALGIEYDGSGFLGWQRHSGGPTVQAAVEAALSFVADAAIEVVCAGRTDAGVHAACQVVHFDSDAPRPPRAWLMGGNTRLPPAVRVLWCNPVADDFHARYGARARRYRYTLLNRPIAPAMQRHFLSWERLPLDAGRMHRAAQALLGEHDFSAYRTAACQAKHPRRDMQAIAVQRSGEAIHFELQANAFLHHMVRNIVGTLLVVGRGEQPEDWPATLLAGRDRTVAGPTAPAAGLVFLGPKYPATAGLPEESTL